MTSIDIKCNYPTYIIKVSGHSNYAESGHDIVCAGISALIGAFHYEIGVMKEQRRMEVSKEIIKSGYAEFELSLFGTEGMSMIEMVINGLRLICDQYPGFTEFHING